MCIETWVSWQAVEVAMMWIGVSCLLLLALSGVVFTQGKYTYGHGMGLV